MSGSKSKQPSILIVEDEPWLAEGQATLLSAEGYRVKIVPHALAAIHEVDELTPDVIVLDILLSGSTGYALLHELQSYVDTGDIPIIVMTSLAPELNIKDLAAYGVKKLLDKATMHPEDLLAAVRSVL